LIFNHKVKYIYNARYNFSSFQMRYSEVVINTPLGAKGNLFQLYRTTNEIKHRFSQSRSLKKNEIWSVRK